MGVTLDKSFLFSKSFNSVFATMARNKKKTMAGKDTAKKARKKTPPPAASSSSSRSKSTPKPSKSPTKASKSTTKPSEPTRSTKRVISTAKTTGDSTNASKKPRGNPGNFHGAPLSVLGSWWEAYAATKGWKQTFWKDFLKEWYQKFPVVDEADDSANAHLDADPDVYFARRASLAVSYRDFLQIIFHLDIFSQTIKRWFSTKKTKHKLTTRGPYDKYLARLGTIQGPPRRPAIHKFYMNHPEYAPIVEAEYQARFGVAPKESDADEDTGGDVEGGAQEERVGGDGVEDSAGTSGADQAAKGGDGEDDDQSDGDEDEEEEDEAKEDEAKKRRNYALSNRVSIAKELYLELSEEEKAALQDELGEHMSAKRAAYESALKGEDLFDPLLLLE